MHQVYRRLLRSDLLGDHIGYTASIGEWGTPSTAQCHLGDSGGSTGNLVHVCVLEVFLTFLQLLLLGSSP